MYNTINRVAAMRSTASAAIVRNHESGEMSIQQEAMLEYAVNRLRDAASMLCDAKEALEKAGADVSAEDLGLS